MFLEFLRDVLGRCLNAIAAEGNRTFFAELCMNIAGKKGYLGRNPYGDTSMLPLHGEYPGTDKVTDKHPISSRGHYVFVAWLCRGFIRRLQTVKAFIMV
jgi:hypothetical protein